MSFGHPRGQRRAPGASVELDLAGGDAEAISDGLSTLAATVNDTIGLFDLGRRPERRFAVGDARQSAKRARHL